MKLNTNNSQNYRYNGSDLIAHKALTHILTGIQNSADISHIKIETIWGFRESY